MNKGTAVDKTLYTLGWKIDETSRLMETGRSILVEVKVLLELLSNDQCDIVAINGAKRLCTICGSISSFITGKYNDITHYGWIICFGQGCTSISGKQQHIFWPF